MAATDGNRLADRAAVAPALAAWLSDHGWLPPGAQLVPFPEGRSNLVWHTGARDTLRGEVVFKLGCANASTPLFPNRPRDEATALESLQGADLAPEFLGQAETPWGSCLMYSGLDGGHWSGDPGPVARAMARLHRLPAPPGLPNLSCDPAMLRRQGEAMLAATGSPLPCPPPPTPANLPLEAPEAFLHGDPTPANILLAHDGLRFIDWQCPGRGDPLLDLAIFLSPAMQLVEGNPPLTQDQVSRFRHAYGDGETLSRLDRLRPLLTWRMACYCQWKLAQGDRAYGPGLGAELALLKELGPDHP